MMKTNQIPIINIIVTMTLCVCSCKDIAVYEPICIYYTSVNCVLMHHVRVSRYISSVLRICKSRACLMIKLSAIMNVIIHVA